MPVPTTKEFFQECRGLIYNLWRRRAGNKWTWPNLVVEIPDSLTLAQLKEEYSFMATFFDFEMSESMYENVDKDCNCAKSATYHHKRQCPMI